MTAEEKERLAVVETEIAGMRGQIEELKQDFATMKRELWTKIDDLCDDMKKRLPLWASFMMAGMSALLTGLIVAMLKR